MKRYDIRIHEVGNGRFYLASDVDRLRAEAREKLAEFIASEVHNDDSAPCTACYTQSEEYLNVIFGEDQT